MAKNLLEAYSKRLQIAESVYGQTHEGQKMSQIKKLTVATCLDNVSRFMNEAFDSSAATQRADMGNWKRFCLNLTNVALPNLIAFDLVMVSPMTSMTGYVAYVEYLAGTSKGQTEQGHLFNSPFKLGDVDAEYTSEAVTETFATSQTVLAWTPVAQDVFKAADGTVLGDVKVIKAADGSVVFGTFASAASAETGTLASMTFKNADGTSATYTIVNGDKIAYKYDNVIIPQEKLPTLKAEIKSIPLLAKARRIAVFYSQIAAFQAKTDYGFDLGDQLAEKAVGQLSYEIDTEVVQLLDSIAKTNFAALDAAGQAELTWSKTLPVGVSKREHYAGFAEILEIAKQKIYDATKRFAPNYMICASNILPVLSMMDGFSAAPAGSINGPYYAGTIGSLKVFISPAMAPGDFAIGVNGSDMMSSVAVYAPYMPIVPTQLLQFADGATSQGFSTMYDLVKLNDALIIGGKITA